MGGSSLHPSPSDRPLVPGGSSELTSAAQQHWHDLSQAACHLPHRVYLFAGCLSSHCPPQAAVSRDLGLVCPNHTYRPLLPQVTHHLWANSSHTGVQPRPVCPLPLGHLLKLTVSEADHVLLCLFPPRQFAPSFLHLSEWHPHPPIPRLIFLFLLTTLPNSICESRQLCLQSTS